MLHNLLRQPLRSSCHAARIIMGRGSNMGGGGSSIYKAIAHSNANSVCVVHCRYLSGSSKVVIQNFILPLAQTSRSFHL